ncbi:MAG: OsmC family protein [Pseudonocardia sp.]|nr:OsmC family protein [Pseudonocardia sp.]
MATEYEFDAGRLASLIDHIHANPSAGKTVWKAETEWKKGLRSEAHIRTHTVPMDEPEQLGGTDTAPNMVEVVLGAYGCCLTTGLVANAAMMGIDLDEISVEIEGDLDLQCFLGLKSPEEVCPGYTSVRARVYLNSSTSSQEELQRLYDKAVPSSPVGSILTRPIEVLTELGQGRLASA